jgi:nucleotide-binding universal stress UspA family protein
VKVLIATDGSEEIYSASRLLVAMIRPEVLSSCIVLTVTWPPHRAPIWNEAAMRRVLVDDMHYAVSLVATEAMEKIAKELAPLGVPVQSLIKVGDPAQQILDTAQEHDVELVVIGRHPQAPTDDRVCERVLSAARCPVLVGSPSAIGRDARVR